MTKDLTEEQKQEIVERAVKDVEQVANLHGFSLASLDSEMVKLLIATYQAGMVKSLELLKQDEQNPNAY